MFSKGNVSILLKNICFPLGNTSFLIKSVPLAALPLPVVVCYSILIQIWWKMLLWLSCLSLWLFLIQFLFKFDGNSSSGCLASSCGRLIFNSYSNLMENTPLAALALPVVVSYSILIQIWCKLLVWLPCLLLWSFAIQFLFNFE